jgi:hypothetical protein
MAQQLEETLAKLLIPDNNTIQQVSATQKFSFLCFQWQCFQSTAVPVKNVRNVHVLFICENFIGLLSERKRREINVPCTVFYWNEMYKNKFFPPLSLRNKINKKGEARGFNESSFTSKHVLYNTVSHTHILAIDSVWGLCVIGVIPLKELWESTFLLNYDSRFLFEL